MCQVQKYGHFALCCRGESDGQRQRVSGRHPHHNAHFVGDQEVSDSEEDCAFAFTVTEVQEETCSVTSGKELVVEVSVVAVTTVVVIDSGSVSNLMGMKQYKELKARGLNAEMENCHKRLYGYGRKELEVMSQIKVEISVGDKRMTSHFVVTKSGRCLLGHVTSKALGLLRIGPGASSGFECNLVRVDLASAFQAKYLKVSDSVTKRKDYKLKLHIDPEVTPITQKTGRVPFALHERVTAKVIVERVEGPMSWISPVVVASKTSGDIRLCVDM